MPHLLIELCRPEHAPRLAPLIQALAYEEGAAPAATDAIATIVEALLTAGASDFLLASIDGEAVGCLQIAYRLSTWQARPYAYLEDFYLAPHVRGRGIGTRLLDYALQRAAGQNSEYVMLDVRAANAAARRLYQRFGFSETGSLLLKRPLAAAHQALPCAQPNETHEAQP